MEVIRRATAGGVVLGDGGTIALVRRRPDTKWFLPKGGVDSGETDETAARREVAEEASLSDLEYLDDLGFYERPPIAKDGSYEQSRLLAIHMYLFAAPQGAMPRAAHEIVESVWMPYREVADALEDPKDRAWFASVFGRVRQAIQRD